MDGAMPRYIEAHNIISDESLTLMFDVRMRRLTVAYLVVDC